MGAVGADRQRVHAADRRGNGAVHADDAARRERREGEGGPAHPGQPAGDLSRGRARVGQGGARDHGDRSGRPRHVRDDDHAEAGRCVAAGDDVRSPHRGNGLRRACRRRDERVDDADQGSHRHARHRDPYTGGHQGLRPRSRRARAGREGGRALGADGTGYAERLRRAGGVGLLPRHRDRSSGGGPARTQRRRHPGGDRDGDRRDDDHAGRGGA